MGDNVKYKKCPGCGEYKEYRKIYVCLECGYEGCRTDSGVGCYPGKRCPKCDEPRWDIKGHIEV